MYDVASGAVKGVPGSKEDVFKNKDISLVDKRRLMRFLMFASGEFEGKPELERREEMAFGEFLKTVFTLNDETVAAIVYALAFCFTAQGMSSYISIYFFYTILLQIPLYAPCTESATTFVRPDAMGPRLSS